MQVAITGATGLVGSALTDACAAAGHQVRRVVRRNPQADDILWKPTEGEMDSAALNGIDAFVHLAGEGIADGRWNDRKKRRIRDSRVDGTRLISETLAGLDDGPRVLISASAIGYYGDRGDEICSEKDPPGQGFLPEVCVQWEAAAEPAAAAGIRVVHPRIGIVLSTRGGALAKMLLPFKLGVAGKLGDGRQYMSWITIDELISTILFAFEHDDLRGPYNAVSPGAVTNHEYTKALGRVLSRPTIFPMPAPVARLAFGEMADALLLSSTRVVPEVVRQQGYAFEWESIEDALRHVIDREI